MSGFMQCLDIWIKLARLAQINKKAVCSINICISKWLKRHRQDSLPVLATGLSDDLLDPTGKGGQWRIAQDRELVAALEGGLADHSSQHQTRIARGRNIFPTLTPHPIRAAQELVQVHAQQRG